MKKIKLFVFLSAFLLVAGCGDYKTLTPIEIGPNETAWAIPLDGTTESDQVKFNSITFLNEKKIATKRVMVDKVKRSTGRMYWDYEWLPAIKVIKVDRSLVTKEWTDSSDTGSSARREGIGVVTKDSIQLRVGLTITASIEEADASTYLYYHGEKPLADVMNQAVRSFAVAELTLQYSELALMEAQTNSQTIYAKLSKDAKEAFKTKGITIQYLGNSEGLTYSDAKVQASINNRYTVEQDAKTAEMEQNAQKIRNATTILTAQATADAAGKLFAAQKASEFQNEMKIRMLEAEAKFRMASNWDGKLPANILPSDSPMLFNLGTGGHGTNSQ